MHVIRLRPPEAHGEAMISVIVRGPHEVADTSFHKKKKRKKNEKSEKLRSYYVRYTLTVFSYIRRKINGMKMAHTLLLLIRYYYY